MDPMAQAHVDTRIDESSETQPYSSRWMSDLVEQPGGAFDKYISKSHALSMTIGTGFDILAAACDFILRHVNEELIFVTCFWTASDSLSRISNLLLALSEKALARKRTIRVRICVSSLSFWQKVLHTWSPKGKTYQSWEWASTFQIPPPHSLRGLDLRIKSVFIPPFSVMHSKFIVMDRKACLLPSCNVSWENWFEGCIDLRGPIVGTFVEYWETVWGCGDRGFSLSQSQMALPTSEEALSNRQGASDQLTGNPHLEAFGVTTRSASVTVDGASLPHTFSLGSEDVQTVFLPHPPHQNPRFRPFPCQSPPSYPQIPLNIFTMQALEGSERSIYLQTPNVTSPPVLDALAKALRRGVDVHIVTNERLMWLEQIVTAGTTTPRCMANLIEAHKRLKREAQSRRSLDGGEEGFRCGNLRIDYFAPGPQTSQEYNSWPVSSHLKLTIVDSEAVILGSGNMDRASWYTSQELGVALISREAAVSIAQRVTLSLEGKLQPVFDSSNQRTTR